MPTRYFRKLSPHVELWMFGREIKFHTFGKFGYIASDDPLIQYHKKGAEAVLAEIDKGIREGYGGVVEMTADQYENEFVKKKASSSSSPALKPHWREEIRADASPDTLAPKLAPVARSADRFEVVDAAPSATGEPVRSLRERANFRR